MKPWLLLLCLLAVVPSGFAEEDASTAERPASFASPEDIIRSYFDGMRRGRADELVQIMHPRALRTFKAMVLPTLDMMADEQGDEQDAFFLDMMGRGDSLDDIRRYPPPKLFERFLDMVLGMNPVIMESLSHAEMIPLGHVVEDDMAHVVFRMNVDAMGVMVSEVSVMSLQDDDGAWKMMLTGEIRGLATMIGPAGGSDVAIPEE